MRVPHIFYSVWNGKEKESIKSCVTEYGSKKCCFAKRTGDTLQSSKARIALAQENTNKETDKLFVYFKTVCMIPNLPSFLSTNVKNRNI